MSVISKITMPTGNSYDIRDNAAGHFLGTTTAILTDNEQIGSSIIISGTTYYLNPSSNQEQLKDQDIVLSNNLLFIANITGTTQKSGTWKKLTFTADAATITDAKIDDTSILTGTVARITTTGAASGAATYDASTNPLATKDYVDTAVQDLPQAMIFRGSLGADGTVTTLPTASESTVGDVYKVITAGTYNSQAAKIGDLFIGTEVTGTPTTYAWTLIPSGDEPSGTVTSVSTGVGLTTADGSPITSSGTIKANLTSETALTGDGVTSVGVDNSGHLAVDIRVVDGTYDASTNKVATQSTVTNAINALDGGEIGTPGTGKTITALSQTDGNISATFSDIAIASSQTTMSSYSKSGTGTTGAITTTDNLDQAIAKLENALDDKQTTLEFDGTYDASNNKVATESTVSDAIDEVISGTTASINGLTAESGNVVTGLEASATSGMGSINLFEVSNETLTIKYLNPSTTAVKKTTNVLQAPTT